MRSNFLIFAYFAKYNEATKTGGDLIDNRQSFAAQLFLRTTWYNGGCACDLHASLR